MHRDAAYFVARVPRFNHVFLDVRAETVLRTEDCGEGGVGTGGNPVGDVDVLMIDRCGIANHPDPPSVECRRLQKAFGTQGDTHIVRIISQGLRCFDAPVRPLTCLCAGPLIDYAPLVVSPACFARAEEPIEPQFRLVLSSASLPSRRATTVRGTRPE